MNITINQQAARIAELEAACKLENELKTAGALRELKLMGEVGELRKQLADLRVDRDTLAGEVKALRVGEDGPDGTYEALYFGWDEWTVVKATRAATDASGALTRAGKDHT